MMNELTDALKDQGLTLVSIDISGTDFKKSLNYKELGLAEDVERELATLGRKSVNSNKFPKLLRNNKDQAYKYLDTYGVRFGTGGWTGSWAVPSDLAAEVITQMEAFREQRLEIKRRLLNAYETDLEDFITFAESKRPGFGEIIRQNAYDKSYVEAQIDFKISHQGDIVNSVSQSAITGLIRNVKEYENAILKKAKESNTRPIISRFTRSKLEEMRDYCYRFTFLTDVLIKAADLLEETINCLPTTVIRSEQYLTETSKVMTTLKLLHTPDELEGIDVVTVQPETEDSDDFYFNDSADTTVATEPLTTKDTPLSDDLSAIADEEEEESETILSSDSNVETESQWNDSEETDIDLTVDDVYEDEFVDDVYDDDLGGSEIDAITQSIETQDFIDDDEDVLMF